MDNSTKTQDNIRAWRERLLDINKRSNLINYKDTKKSTLELLSPDFSKAFSRICSEVEIDIYEENKADIEIDEESKDGIDLDAESFLQKHKNKIRQSQFVFFNNFTYSRNALKILCQKSEEAIDERGVNILFLAFGFINWKESDDSSLKYKAPLVMVPVSLKNRGITKPYSIVMNGDISLNASIQYLIKKNFDIHVPSYEEETPIEEYLEKVQEEVAPLGFEVSHEIRLATFSFNKLNMYLDLEENIENVTSNACVKAISGDPVDEDIFLDRKESERITNTRDLFSTQHNVVDADFSQTEAIEYALSGKSFVLQGPPGTGKSQTITNIIAELIYNGKKVLFVSEKLAALEVVYNNLAKAGLDKFCLELHSNKAKKKEFINSLYNTLMLGETNVTDEGKEIIEHTQEERERLNLYNKKLHTKRKGIQLSLYEMLGRYYGINTKKTIIYPIDDIANKDLKYLNKIKDVLVGYANAVKNLTIPKYEHPFYGFYFRNPNTDTFSKFFNDLEKYTQDLTILLDICKKLESEFNVYLNTFKDVADFLELVDFSQEKMITSNKLLDCESLDTYIESIKGVVEKANLIKKIDDKLDKNFKKEIRSFDYKEAEDIYNNSSESYFIRLFNKDYQKAQKSIRKYFRGTILTRKKAFECFRVLNERKREIEYFDISIQDYKDTFEAKELTYDTNWIEFRSELNSFKNILKKTNKFTNINLEGLTRQLTFTVKKSFEELKKSLKYFSKYFSESEKVFETYSLKDWAEKIELMEKNRSLFTEWMTLCKADETIYENELVSFINQCAKEEVDEYDLELYFEKAFYKSCIEKIYMGDWNLYSYERRQHSNDVGCFQHNDKKCLDISKAIILSNIVKTFPDPTVDATGGPVTILKREHNKARNIKTIRELFGLIPSLIQTLKPCFMMSPLSVSTYLPKGVKFDTVIFDEASQVFPEDAIVAMYRAKQTIVVGDSKQMPPTRFFMTTDSEDDIDDEYNEEVTSYESILDLCQASFPSKSLLCHYRSRCESLINFSNKHFYKGDLVTFPSTVENRKDMGVDFEYIPDGVFSSKTKTNIREAERVADLVFEHFRNHPEQSLGVVAFSIRQQEAIIKTIEKRRKLDQSYEEFFSKDRSEPFFVKNLETVQGDERDTIIFSITYGKNESGKFALRFGPLNLKGGERRLNVAITRAKFNVKVVSSIRCYDIDVSKVTNEGPKLLHGYLDYAENGSETIFTDSRIIDEKTFDSPFEKDVYDYLVENGFSVDTQVGCSKYKIDMAVKKPGTSDYILAIECDGASYHSSKSARDRDRLRQGVLERMGWKFYRIWSTDWYKNNANEKRDLLQECLDAFENNNHDNIGTNSENIEDSQSFLVEIPKTEHKIFDKYFSCKVSSYTKWENDVVDIVRIEGPVSIKSVVRRLYKKMGYGSPCKPAAQDIMHWFFKKEIIFEDDFMFMTGQKSLYMREGLGQHVNDIEEISIYEIRNGMYKLIENQKWTTKEGLFNDIRKYLGFARTGDKITNHLEKAYRLLRHHIYIDGERLKINENNKLNLWKRGIE